MARAMVVAPCDSLPSAQLESLKSQKKCSVRNVVKKRKDCGRNPFPNLDVLVSDGPRTRRTKQIFQAQMWRQV